MAAIATPDRVLSVRYGIKAKRQFFGASAYLKIANVDVIMCVRRQGTTRLPLGGFS